MICIVRSPMKKGNWNTFQLPFLQSLLWCFGHAFYAYFYDYFYSHFHDFFTAFLQLLLRPR
jgi:hypothetical protein